ncbi:MAG: 2-C-methyl-D-erythritol 2,4-cyclodiphosphate synthase [Chloroflexota bacterium]
MQDAIVTALFTAAVDRAAQQPYQRVEPTEAEHDRLQAKHQLVPAAVMGQLEAASLRPDSADVTILGVRPRLGGQRLDAMAATIAGLLRLGEGRVSVKAATGNLSGDEGSGRAISATCLVSVVAS